MARFHRKLIRRLWTLRRRRMGLWGRLLHVLVVDLTFYPGSDSDLWIGTRRDQKRSSRQTHCAPRRGWRRYIQPLHPRRDARAFYIRQRRVAKSFLVQLFLRLERSSVTSSSCSNPRTGKTLSITRRTFKTSRGSLASPLPLCHAPFDRK